MATQQYTPQYQDSNYLGKLANNIYNSTQGTRNQQYANANQAYNNSGRNMAEALGAKGLLHSGTYANELIGNEQNRNTALSGVDASAYNSALSQAVSAGQLGLSEQGQLANQNLAQQGVTNQNTQYNQGQAQQASQFGVTAGQSAQQIANQASQYAQGQAQQASQFGQNLGLSQAQLAQQGSQYTQGQAQQAAQYGQSIAEQIAARIGSQGQSAQQIANQASQYAQGQAQQASQFGQNLGLSQAQLAAQQSQFGQNFGLQQQQTANEASQYAQSLAEQTASRLGSQGLTQQQITNQAAQTAQEQANQAAQYAQGQAQQASQFGQNLGLQQAALTGQYQGVPTAATADQSYSQQLALLQALQNYNLGVGQVTDALPQFSGYNYGDTLKTLLGNLGGASNATATGGTSTPVATPTPSATTPVAAPIATPVATPTPSATTPSTGFGNAYTSAAMPTQGQTINSYLTSYGYAVSRDNKNGIGQSNGMGLTIGGNFYPFGTIPGVVKSNISGSPAYIANGAAFQTWLKNGGVVK